MAILTYLDLSTSHVRLSTWHEITDALTSERRTELGWPAMSIASDDCGVFVTVPEFDDEDEAQRGKALPFDLLAVLLLASNLGASVVRLDSDGDVMEQLRTYDW